MNGYTHNSKNNMAIEICSEWEIDSTKVSKNTKIPNTFDNRMTLQPCTLSILPSEMSQ